MKTFLLILSLFLVTISSAQTDTTSSSQDYFLTFVKKVYLNPTVYLRTTDFKERTNLGFVALPDLSSAQNNANSGFEKGLQKLLRLLMQTDGGVRFYFNPDNPTHPFTFWSTENLWCKFKQPEKDSIDYYLNHAFSDSNLDLNNNQRFESTIDQTLDYIERVLAANPAECGDEPQNETTTINTKPLAINVHNTQGSKFDIDYKAHDQLASNYGVATDIFTQQQWYAPSKMFVTGKGAEPLTMSISLHDPQFKTENLKIEMLKSHTLLAHTYSNDSIRFSLPDNLVPSDPLEIVVRYKSQVDTITYTVGFFMVNVVEEQTPRLVLLGANGYTIGSADVSNIQNYLDKIYNPVGVAFDVSSNPFVFMNDYPTLIQDEGSGLLSNYPSDLHDYVGDVKDLEDFDQDSYFLVLGLSSTNAELKGYMPRARNIGFIFFPEGETSFLPATVAHELGHGAFHFRHIFDEEELGEDKKGGTSNLMDYCFVEISDALYLHQWNFIQDPAFVSWFGGDDEDAQSGHVESGIPESWWKNGLIGFITPGNSRIVFDRNLDDAYIAIHPNDFPNDLENMNLQGTLLTFYYTLQHEEPVNGYYEDLNPTRFDAKFSDGTFLGYKDAYGNPFMQYSVPSLLDSILVPVLYYNTVNVFRAKAINLPFYEFDSKPTISVLNDIASIDNNVKIGEKPLSSHALTSGFFKLDSENYYSEDALKVLLGAQKTYPSMSIAWKIAALRSLYPEIYDKMTVYGFNVLKHNVMDNDIRVGLCQLGDMVVSASDWFGVLGQSDEYTSCGYYDYKYSDNDYELYSELEQGRLFLLHFQELIKAYKEIYQPVIDEMLQPCASNVFLNSSNVYTAEIIKNAVMGMSTTEVVSICPSVKTKLIAIILDPSILNLGIVSESYERSILKLILNTSDDDEYALLKKLCTEKFDHTEIIIKTIADAVDDETCWIGKDNYTVIMNWVIKVYNKHPVAADNKLSDVTLENLDYDKYLYLQKHIVTYNYQGFCERLFKSVIPGLATISFDMKEADLETEVTIYNKKVVYVNHSLLGFSSYSQTEPMYLDPLEAVVLDDKSNLLDIYGSDSELGGYIVPAIILYFAERKADSRTTTEVIQTIVDVATFFIPGGQATGLMKILNYADKLSSVASIASNYCKEDSPETSAALGYLSAILGLADASGGALKHTDFSQVEDFGRSLFGKLNKSRSVYNTEKHIERVTKACDDFINNANPKVLMLKADPDSKKFMKQLFEGELQAAKKAENWAVYNKVKKAINSLDNLNVPIPDVDLYNKLADFNDYWSNNALFAKKADNTSIKIAHVDAEKRLIFDHFDDATDVSSNAKLSRTLEDQVWYEFKNNKYVQKKEDMLFFDDNGVIKCLHGKNCFASGTVISSNRGKIPIEQVTENDSVKSYNEETSQFEWKKVTQTFKNYSSKMLRLIIGNDTIWSTKEHPFYVGGSWLKASLLTIGMQVLTTVGYSEVTSVAEKDSLVTTYNLNVEGNHNYLVGNEGLLVHNGCGEVGEMLERLGDDKPAFWADFKENSALLDKFGDGVYSEKAWQKLQEFENFRKDEKFLRIATDLLPLKVKYKVQNNIFKILSENNTVLAELVSDGAGGSYFKILQKVDDVPSANQKSLAGFICKNEEGAELSGGFVKRADGSVKFVSNSGNKIIRQSTQADLDLITSIRTKYNAGVGRNIAFSKGNIGDDAIDLECVSGAVTPQNALQKGNFIPPQNTYYDGILGYENHTEQKIIEYLRAKYLNNKNVIGEIEIVSERPYCENCVDIVDQFQEEFKNIIITRVEVVK